MDNLFSVIIPIYNVENYVEECINSVIDQDYENIEILLINDGSKDNSQLICEKKVKEDSRIRLINKQNGGLSSARNAGLDNATGDYILFLDGDDYWDDKEALSKINQNLQNSQADIVTFGLKKIFEDTGEIEEAKYVFNRQNIDFDSKKNTLSYLVKNNLYISSACNKAVKKSIIDKYNLRFEDKALSEDIEWSAKLLLYSNVIDVIESPFYIYRQRSHSITHTLKLINIEYLVKHIQTCIELCKNENIDYKNEYMGYVAYQYITLLVSLNSVEDKIPLEMMKRIKDYSYLLKYDLIKRVHIFNLINKFLGFSMLNLFIKFYLKIRKG